MRLRTRPPLLTYLLTYLLAVVYSDWDSEYAADPVLGPQ